MGRAPGSTEAIVPGVRRCPCFCQQRAGGPAWWGRRPAAQAKWKGGAGGDLGARTQAGAENHSPGAWTGVGSEDTDMAFAARGGPLPPSSPAELGCSASLAASRLVFPCCALRLLSEPLSSSCLVARRLVLRARRGLPSVRSTLTCLLPLAGCISGRPARRPACAPASPRSCPACPAVCLAPLPSLLSPTLRLIPWIPGSIHRRSMKPCPFQTGFPLELWVGNVLIFFF